MPIVLKSQADIAKMRAAGDVVHRAHAIMREMVRPGVTTGELDRAAHEFIMGEGGYPSFLGYNGFPKSICASVNEELVHGIPGERVLNEGDIITIDIGVKLDGFHGDAAVTYAVGEISDEARELIAATEESFWIGYRTLRAGARLGDMGAAIQEYVEGLGYGVVRGYGGHGIGRLMHEDPHVPNTGEPGEGTLLRPGMTIAVEPMVSAGSPEVQELEDGWTVVMVDGSLAAHYEHTVAITPDGALILTDGTGGDAEPNVMV